MTKQPIIHVGPNGTEGLTLCGRIVGPKSLVLHMQRANYDRHWLNETLKPSRFCLVCVRLREEERNSPRIIA